MKRVLVVDDLQSIRELIVEIVSSLGYEVFVAENGQEAINFFQNNGKADLVITDRRMPKMGGEELTRWIKRNHHNVQVILITGDDLEIFGPIAYAAGADEVLSKPVSIGLLQQTIKNLID